MTLGYDIGGCSDCVVFSKSDFTNELELNVLSFVLFSVGGTDYGSARVGTYMGRKMIKCAASDLLSQSFPSVPMQSSDTNSDDYEEHGVDLLRSEASLEYLCNLPPHRSHVTKTDRRFVWFCIG